MTDPQACRDEVARQLRMCAEELEMGADRTRLLMGGEAGDLVLEIDGCSVRTYNEIIAPSTGRADR